MPDKKNHKVRIVTAASLFDGHDAAINIMRRIMQSKGAEIIHLGHNRSVHEIVECAIEEDADAIAITSYQGGHIEFFKYMKDLLDQNGYEHIKIFGGGGGIFGGGQSTNIVVNDGIIRTEQTSSETRAIGQVGGGMEVRMTPHIGWVSDFSWNFVFGPNNNFGMVRTGVNFAF